MLNSMRCRKVTHPLIRKWMTVGVIRWWFGSIQVGGTVKVGVGVGVEVGVG